MSDNLIPRMVKDGKRFCVDGRWYGEGEAVMVSPLNASANLRDMTITEYNILDIEVPKHLADKTANPRLNLEHELKLAIVDDLLKNGSLTQKEIAKVEKFFFKTESSEAVSEI